ncbi:hypothetical protein imdm_1171 [gamma proteobacterium IMCC2047]|nr:hypothetical protein imdm_1171 [gamma proteobacterium IMCC2047]
MAQKAPLRTPRKFNVKSLVLTAGLLICSPSWGSGLSEAQQSFDKAEYATAVIQLKNLLQENPNNSEARLLLGLTYLKQMSVQAATKELEKARQLGIPAEQWAVPLARSYFLSNNPDSTIALIDQQQSLATKQQAQLLAIVGHAQLSKNLIIDGKETFQQAIAIQDNAYANVGLARIAMFEKAYETAAPLLENALKLEPNNFDALITQSQLYVAQQQPQAAIKPLDHALSLDPFLQSARVMRSELYVRTNQLDKARKDANTLLEQNPNNGLAHFILARLLLSEGKYKAAQTASEKALRAIPEHLMTHFILGASHYAQGNFERAQFYLEKFVAAQPSHLIANRLMGAVYLQLKDANSAVQLLDGFVQRTNTKDAQLLNLLGRAYLQAGDYNRGTEMLNLALEIDPAIENTRTQLAIGQIASGDINSAISELENAVTRPDATEQTNIMLILSYLNQQQYDNAFAAIDKAIAQYPKSPAFLNLKAIAYENQQNTEAAREAYQQALAIDDQFIPALLALAKLEARNKQFDAAKAHINNALKINKNHLQSHLLMAQIAGLNNNPKALVSSLEKARDGNPSAYQPVSLLVNYYLQTNDLVKARREASRFYTAQGRNAGSLSLMARVSLAANEADKARSYLLEIIDSNEQDINHRLQLAQLEINEKQYDDALTLINEVLTLRPKHASALSMRVTSLIAQQRFKDAQQALETFGQHYPNSFLNHRLRGDLLVAQQKTSDAIDAYQQGFDQTKTPYLANQLAGLYQQINKTDLAIATLETYLEGAPHDLQRRMTLAALYQQAKNNQRAIKQYEIITSNEKNVAALNNLAWLYWLEKSDKALNNAQQAHQLAPNIAAVIDTYGWIMLHMGDQDEALQLLRKAASKSPSNPDIRYHLAKALAMNGDKAQAKKEVDRLLRDYAGFEEEAAAKTLAAEL